MGHGDEVLWSNYITYATASLSVHLSMLLTGIIIHEYNPDDLLMGTIIPLHKDKHGNICCSDQRHLSIFLYNSTIRVVYAKQI